MQPRIFIKFSSAVNASPDLFGPPSVGGVVTGCYASRIAVFEGRDPGRRRVAIGCYPPRDKST